MKELAQGMPAKKGASADRQQRQVGLLPCSSTRRRPAGERRETLKRWAVVGYRVYPEIATRWLGVPSMTTAY